MTTVKNLVCLRGLARGVGHWGDFPQVLKEIAPDLNVKLIDLPGNGLLHKQTTPKTAEGLISVLRKSTDFKGQSFYILGVSLGGMIALKWAELFPEEVLGLIVINSSLAQYSPFYKRMKPAQYLQMIRVFLEDAVEKREEIVLGFSANNPARRKKFLHEFAQFSKLHPIKFRSFLRQLNIAAKLQIPETLSVPMRIIYSKGDSFVDGSCSEELARHFRAPMSVNPTAGHDLPLDEPLWLAEEIKAYLKV